jgi:hypothetical protein
MTRTAAHATEYVRVRPGTHIAAIYGMLWHIFENGWEDASRFETPFALLAAALLGRWWLSGTCTVRTPTTSEVFVNLKKSESRNRGRRAEILTRGPAKGDLLLSMCKDPDCDQCERRVSDSASHAPAQFGIEFGSNRSDDICGVVLGEAADEEHLIS